jgi:hypothetical protein
LSRSRDFTFNERTEGIDRKFVAEISFGMTGCDTVRFRRRGDFPVGVIGCPLLKKTREAAEGGRSFFFGLGSNIGSASDRFSDCAVVERDCFRLRRDGLW